MYLFDPIELFKAVLLLEAFAERMVERNERLFEREDLVGDE